MHPKVLAPVWVSGGSFANGSSGVGSSLLQPTSDKIVKKNKIFAFIIKEF
jgi:hypothetical protein